MGEAAQPRPKHRMMQWHRGQVDDALSRWHRDTGPMIIQPLRQQMIPDVIALMQRGEPFITARTYSDYWLYANLFSSTCPVAVVDGHLVGSVIAFRSQDEPGEVYVQDVMTHPNFRKRGVTRGLIAHVRERAEAMNCRRIYLTSEPHNSAAHRAWSALGFVNVPGDRTVDGVSVITDFKGPGKTRAVYELTISAVSGTSAG
ncbi:GNAT family N-acetyltransferase [Nocardia iowensis]|uniref:GNAT family N-acetyltransferase n=1 Tax=Nocardia iowensis TaxID=204891 RepID=A0ABX8S0Y0_NOCIO|nr:GNAT family N-acetyltransferase [Nocardia iowensis]QXN94742.1 GNAT family N-acetyltransferase [Nocardia iowensis]